MKKNNIFKKTFLIIVLAIIPLMLVIGAASWIMLSEERIKPQYNPNSAFYQYLNGQTVTYNGSEQMPEPKLTPTGTTDNSLINMDKETIEYTCYKKNASGNYVSYENGTPKDAGEYILRFVDTDDETNGAYPASDVYFKIEKATLINPTVSINYNQIQTSTENEYESYFSTEMNTANIQYNSVFKFNEVEVPGTTIYSDSNSLSIGTNKYQYTFTPDSDNFNIYNGEIDITTYATVRYLDDNGSTVLEKQYCPYGSSVTFNPSVSDYYNLLTYPEEKVNFSCWTLNGTAIGSNYKIIDDVDLVAEWNYIIHKLEFINVSLDSNGKFIYTNGNKYSITKTFKELQELPYTVEVPTSDIKHFRRWGYNNKTQEGTLTISSFYNYNEDYTDTYTAYWWDIVTVGNLIYDYANDGKISYSGNILNDALAKTNFYIEDTSSDYYSILSNNITNWLIMGSLTNGYYTFSKTSSASIPGSTYLLSIQLSNMAGFVIKDYKNNIILPNNYFEIIVMYKTAKYNNVDYTIEEAIGLTNVINKDTGSNVGGTISLHGDSTSSSSYIETCFTNIDFSSVSSIIYLTSDSTGTISKNYYSTSYYNTSYGVNNTTIVVPSDAGNNLLVNETGSSVVYSVLTVPDNITLSLSGSSQLNVCGYISGDGIPTTTTLRGVLMNYGNIILNNGCSVYSYGFVKGTGMIELISGAEAIDCIMPHDWLGGNTTNKIYTEAFPTNAWSMHNIACDLKINAGAYFKVYMAADLSIVGLAAATTTVIGTASPCLFIGESGYLIKKTSPADIWEENKSTYSTEYSSLSSITGSNQLTGQKEILEIYGNFKDSEFNIKVSKLGQSINMSTSTNISLPFGFTSVNILIGTLTLECADYLFLPGTSLTIGEGSSLITEKNVDLSFECIANISSESLISPSENTGGSSACFNNYCKDKVDAKCIVKGSLISEGNIGGCVLPGSSSAYLYIVGNNYSSFKSPYWKIATTELKNAYTIYSVTEYPVYGYINSTLSYSSLKQGEHFAFNNNGVFYWTGDSEQLKSYTGTLNYRNGYIEQEPCITADTLITLADGTQKRVDQLTGDELLLVWDHTLGKMTTARITHIVSHDQFDVNHKIIKLIFSDGSYIKMIGEHVYFDATQNKYVAIDENNINDFINHSFIKNGNNNLKEVKLVNYEVYYEYTRSYEIVTDKHLTCFTNDILSASALQDPFLNMFDFADEGYVYDIDQMQKDIEKYGVYTYDDFEGLISEELFERGNAQYLKIAVEKGYVTWEELLLLIEHYNNVV